jgi:hypothetical protein
MALAGAAAGVAGLLAGFAALMAVGLLAAVLAAVAIVLHRRLVDVPLRTHAARASRLRAELASWSAALAIAAILAVLAVQAFPMRTDLVAGKPVEVRAWSRLVVMPDGRTYRFKCGNAQRETYDCPALAKWRALPRWPEPQHVEMRVFKDYIVDLRMDDQVIVDRKVDSSDPNMKLLMGIAAFALAIIAIRATWRRVRQLIGLASPRKTTRRASRPH